MDSKSDEKCLKKTNLLVYKEPTGQKTRRKGPCGDAGKYPPKFKIPICPGQPKQIRICTGADMKKMRPPVLCKCDKVSRYASRRRGGMLGFLGFGLKAALAAAAWYVTYDMGIWGTSDDTYEMYRSYCKIMKGPCPDKEEKWEPVQCKAEKQLMTITKLDPYACCDDPPINLQRQAYDLQNRWNHTISYIFSGIARFPFNMINKIIGTPKEEEEVIEKECVLYNELPQEEKEELIRNAYRK